MVILGTPKALLNTCIHTQHRHISTERNHGTQFWGKYIPLGSYVIPLSFAFASNIFGVTESFYSAEFENIGGIF